MTDMPLTYSDSDLPRYKEVLAEICLQHEQSIARNALLDDHDRLAGKLKQWEATNVPTAEQLLEAAPHACWRECFSCGNQAFHVDNSGRQVACRECGSMDTRLLRNPTANLRTAAGLE